MSRADKLRLNKDQKAWLLGRCLDFCRLLAVFGVVLILAAGPYVILELARFDCTTTLAEGHDVAITDVSWDYTQVSTVALLSITAFCVNALPENPDNWAEVVVAVASALLPVLWSPMLLGVAASPNCPDTALLHDAHTTATTLPSGPASITTEDAVIDEAARVLALGVLLVGLGSSLLSGYLIHDTVQKGRPYMNGTQLHGIIVIVALFVYFCGAVSVYHAGGLKDDVWANDALNNDRALAECTEGSGKVFGRAIAARDRGAFTDLDVCVFALSLMLLLCILVGFLYEYRTHKKTNKRWSMVGGMAFVLCHFLASLVLAQAVYVGSNPVCAQATLGGERAAARGIVAMAYGVIMVALHSVVAVPAQPLARESWANPAPASPGPPKPHIDISRPTSLDKKTMVPRRIISTDSEGEYKGGESARYTNSDNVGLELVITDPIVRPHPAHQRTINTSTTESGQVSFAILTPDTPDAPPAIEERLTDDESG
eukprot:m.5714 g.5714  ORF g.5714 m.5714 type:complete len:486 (-) comp1792_c0_seq1:280-1737(-)